MALANRGGLPALFEAFVDVQKCLFEKHCQNILVCAFSPRAITVCLCTFKSVFKLVHLKNLEHLDFSAIIYASEHLISFQLIRHKQQFQAFECLENYGLQLKNNNND